jgi:hypothetical protein
MRATVLALLLVVGSIRATFGLDVTGTWQMRGFCRVFSTGQGFHREPLGGFVDMTQSGMSVNVQENVPSSLFNGLLMADPNNPARGAMATRSCGMTADFGMSARMYHLKITVGPDGTAIATGWRIANLNGVTSFCKVRLQRTSTADPNIPACP